jgi:hypothetical protein
MFRDAMTPEESFVRSLWLNVPSEDDVSWVRRVAALPLKNEPLGDYGALVKRMLECGLSEYEIARFAKIVGYETAFCIAYMLGDPTAGLPSSSNPENVSWALFQTDETSEAPIAPLCGVHELVLRMDPSGREMRPKSGASEQSKT